MVNRQLAVFLVITLACAGIFLGCAAVPREELEEKDAIIQNLNTQIENLKQEIDRLRRSNNELMAIKSELEEKLREKDQSLRQKSAGEEKGESKIK